MQISAVLVIAATLVASASAGHSKGPDFSKLISPCPGGLANENDDGSCSSNKVKRSALTIRGVSWFGEHAMKRSAEPEPNPAPVAVAVPANDA